jgi:ABC transporter with metal-binding/Fe-S-binding domain ATP-binding protein
VRVAALLSGGKDSVATVEVARGHGWDTVVGVRMVPEKDDAYMFHTPNLAVVAAVAECLDMPLVSASARPDAVGEVDDLEQALARAMEEHRLDGVVSGALASEYQRTHIDRIGHRLGLRTFAPLWHKHPRCYLTGLVAGGYDIRFSRVAADGLDATWAGARLDAARIERLAALRLHLAGEGGEYETLVLDAPHYSRRIVVDAATIEATASRATWHVSGWHTEPKPSPPASPVARPRLNSHGVRGA